MAFTAALDAMRCPKGLVLLLIGHGVFDFVHRHFIDNPDVPRWWPGFCLAFDGFLGGLLAVYLIYAP